MFNFEEDGFRLRKEYGGCYSFLERRARREFLTLSH